VAVGSVCFFPPLSLKVLNLTNCTTEQHGEDHSEQLDDTNSDASGEHVGEVLVDQRFQLWCAALNKKKTGSWL
jgi:hypothetical protein